MMSWPVESTSFFDSALAPFYHFWTRCDTRVCVFLLLLFRSLCLLRRTRILEQLVPLFIRQLPSPLRNRVADIGLKR